MDNPSEDEILSKFKDIISQQDLASISNEIQSHYLADAICILADVNSFLSYMLYSAVENDTLSVESDPEFITMLETMLKAAQAVLDFTEDEEDFDDEEE